MSSFEYDSSVIEHLHNVFDNLVEGDVGDDFYEVQLHIIIYAVKPEVLELRLTGLQEILNIKANITCKQYSPCMYVTLRCVKHYTHSILCVYIVTCVRLIWKRNYLCRNENEGTIQGVEMCQKLNGNYFVVCFGVSFCFVSTQS